MVNLIIITFASAMWLSIHIADSLSKERCSSGLRGTPGKRVYLQRVSGVRIPLFPPFPLKKRKLIMASFFAFITKITGMASHGRTCSVRNPYGRIGKSYALLMSYLCK